MKKIDQGMFELHTYKADAIRKFRQMQGICREEISNEDVIEFCCSKRGRIVITNPYSRKVEHENSTNLYARVVEENGKTYVSYYTTFSNFTNVSKILMLLTYLLTMVGVIVFSIVSKSGTFIVPVALFGLCFYLYELSRRTKEGTYASADSEILVNELEKRVHAVNLWDK